MGAMLRDAGIPPAEAFARLARWHTYLARVRRGTVAPAYFWLGAEAEAD